MFSVLYNPSLFLLSFIFTLLYVTMATELWFAGFRFVKMNFSQSVVYDGERPITKSKILGESNFVLLFICRHHDRRQLGGRLRRQKDSQK